LKQIDDEVTELGPRAFLDQKVAAKLKQHQRTARSALTKKLFRKIAKDKTGHLPESAFEYLMACSLE
jgi:hypothetical protein